MFCTEKPCRFACSLSHALQHQVSWHCISSPALYLHPSSPWPACRKRERRSLTGVFPGVTRLCFVMSSCGPSFLPAFCISFLPSFLRFFRSVSRSFCCPFFLYLMFIFISYVCLCGSLSFYVSLLFYLVIYLFIPLFFCLFLSLSLSIFLSLFPSFLPSLLLSFFLPFFLPYFFPSFFLYYLFLSFLWSFVLVVLRSFVISFFCYVGLLLCVCLSFFIYVCHASFRSFFPCLFLYLCVSFLISFLSLLFLCLFIS